MGYERATSSIATMLLASAAIAGGCAAEELNRNPGRDRSADGDPAAESGPSCTETYAGPSASRRLTRFEYENTVRDLLGDTSSVTSSFPAEEVFYGFDNHATDRGVSFELASEYMYAAERIANRASLAELVPCDPATGDDACARAFITTFGKRAYRRPLKPAEIDSLMTTFEQGKDGGDFDSGVRWVLQRILQAPSFLYRVELQPAAPADAKMVPVDGWELASRLSYFLWGTMPDDALFAAAEKNALSSKEEVAAQARRMLEDPRAHEVVRKFHHGWLDLDALDFVVKSSTVYPGFSPDMIPLMKEETERFVEDVVFGGGDFSTLFTASYTFANDKLAPLYGLTGVTGSEMRRVELDPSQRAGVLTQLGFLSATSKANQTSPILRGKFVRTRILCDAIPSPPMGVSVAVPDPQPNQSTRERFAALTANPSCQSCHKQIDPIGFGFEHYDGVGQWRTEDHGPIDASGEAADTDVGTFDGAVELGKKLAESEEARQCMTRQWFRYVAGRIETDDDKCTLAQLDASFAAAGYDIKELLVAITQTDGFLYRAVSP